MPRRLRYADALARVLFSKPLDALSHAERAELDVLRALDADGANEEPYEQLASGLEAEADGRTIH
jgi:hypothetical protein